MCSIMQFDQLSIALLYEYYFYYNEILKNIQFFSLSNVMSKKKEFYMNERLFST